MREKRLRHSELSEESRKKATTRAYTNVLKGRGKLTPEPCVFCGEEKAEAHHPDYDDPRKVVWACPPCHREHFHQE